MIKEIEILSKYLKNTLATTMSRATWLPADAVLPVSALPKPLGITYEVTDACNSRCQSCNIWQSKSADDHLKPHEVYQILMDPLFEEVQSVIITGGEATLRGDLLDLMLQIHKARPRAELTLSTNGLIPKRAIDTVKSLLDLGVPVTVGISLDALGERHDFLRGVAGNFLKVDGLIRELHALGKQFDGMVRITIPQTLSPETTTDIMEVDKYCDMMGVNHYVQLYEEFSYYSNTPETLKDLKYKLHIDGALGHHLSSEDTLGTYAVHPLKILDQLPPGPQNEYLMKSIRDNRPMLHATSYRRNVCSSLSNFFLLRANGDVAPCLRWSHLRYANLRKTSPSELWASQPIREGRKMVRECSGCTNSWATDWTSQRWYFPFFPMMFRAYFKRKVTHRHMAKSLSRPITSCTPTPLPIEEIERRLGHVLRTKARAFKFEEMAAASASEHMTVAG